MAKGTITIDINPIDPAQRDRIRDVFMDLLRSGSLNVRNGSVTMHFNSEGELMMIDSHTIKWKRRKI